MRAYPPLDRRARNVTLSSLSMKTLLCALVLAGLALAGCSSDERRLVWISYLPPRDLAGSFRNLETRPVTVAPVADKREVDDPALLVADIPGATRIEQTRYRLAEPLPVLVHDHVRQMLVNAGGQVVPPAEASLQLDGAVTAVSMEEFAGALYSDLMARISAEFTLRDQAGNLLWSDSFTGSYLLQRSTDIKRAYTGAMDGLMRQLARNQAFREALATGATSG
jgi:hypothetical protein